MDAIVELDHVTVAYDCERLAVRDASLSVPAGQFVALVGPSGSGKTSLLKTINRLVQPASGVVRVEGRNVVDFVAHDLRRRIGYVFQSVGLFPHMSVAENIGVTMRLLRRPAAEIDGRVAEMIDLVGLPRAYLARAPLQLSGGERQRVAVARALAANPRIVIMDEPFGALDPVTRDGLGAAYRSLHEHLGLTTLMVTHDVQEAALLADRIVVLRDGAIVAEGAPRELMRRSDGPVADMFEVPRRQAERLTHMLAGDA